MGNILFVILAVIFAVERIHGGVVITQLNGLYLSQNIKDGNDTTYEQTKTYLNLDINYLSSSRFLLGALYINDTQDSGSNIEKTTGFGPQMGYLFGSWGVVASYLTQMEYVPSSSVTGKWTEGSGYQVALNYLGLNSLGIYWGFQWVYRVVEFKKYFDGVTVTEAQRKAIDTFPQIKIGYAF